MTRRTRTPIWILASVLALAGCAHPAGVGNANPRRSGQGGFGAVDGDSPGPNPYAGDPTATQTNNSNTGNGTGNGGGTSTTRSPSPSPARTGPQIVTFTAKNAVCPDQPPYAPYVPGQVTISWKISGADTVDLLMDNGLWKSYPGQQGTDTLPFQCDNNHGPLTVSHSFTLTIKNTNVSKTISASAHNNPN